MTLDQKKRKDHLGQLLFVIGGILLYLFLLGLLQTQVFAKGHYYIGKYELDATTINGALTQLQMLLSIALVLSGGKRNYVITVALNVFGVVSATVYFIYSQRIGAILGTLSYFGVLLIISLINSYKVRTRKQLGLLAKKEEELRKLAFFDGLTGILNRNTFIDELDILIDLNKKVGSKMYVVFIDIDDFKIINDSMGHAVGDIVLGELANRMKMMLHEEDIIGRLGGDEIGIIIKHKMEAYNIQQYIMNLQSVIIQTCQVEGKEIQITASIGVSEYPVHGNSSKELLKKADIAMYQSKREGKNKISYYSVTV